jgi:hypothetical protein
MKYGYVAAVEASHCDSVAEWTAWKIDSRVPDDVERKWNFIARFGFLRMVLMKIHIL